MRFAHEVVAADKGGQRDGFGGREGRIPSGTMLDWGDDLPIAVAIFMDGAMRYQLPASRRVLSLGQAGELLCTDCAGQPKMFRQLSMPFPLNGVSLLPIVLLGCGELFGMVGLRLGCRERF